MRRVSGRTLRTPYFVNSGEVASDEMLLITLLLMTCPQELFFRLVSSDALLQTHFFRRSKLQLHFLCSLTCSIRISMNSTLIIDPVHLNKFSAYPIDNF